MSKITIWALLIVLALALSASATWYIVAAPGGANGVELHNTSTLYITDVTLSPDAADPNGILCLIKMQMSHN
jgi:hypothetical protein